MNKLYLFTGSLILTLVINYLAVNLPLNGITTQAVSDLYLNYFTPAGYVFSIWGLIYTSLLVVTFQFWKDKKKYSAYLEKTGYLYTALNLLNAFWLVLWHYNLILFSIIVMGLILYCLIKIYLFGKETEFKIVQFTNSLYLGWISVATIANMAVFIVYIYPAISNSIEVVLTLVMYAVALTLGLLMLVLKKDKVFFFVIVWAIIGILVRYSSNYAIFSGGLIILLSALIYAVFEMFGWKSKSKV